jgi:hypothetical protein
MPVSLDVLGEFLSGFPARWLLEWKPLSIPTGRPLAASGNCAHAGMLYLSSSASPMRSPSGPRM